MITSLQNDKVKLAHALQTRSKARRKTSQIVLEGTRLVRDALLSGQQPDFALVTVNADVDLLALLRERGVKPLAVADEVLRHISDTEQPQGVIAVFPMPTPTLPDTLTHVLILDAIRDPGNMGTLLRTAAAAGVEAVLLAPDCVDPYNPKALRGGMGAHFRVLVISASWDKIAAYCQNLRVYLADGQGEMPYDAVDWSAGWALIVGSEAHGASDAAASLARQRIRIPMAAATDSLNAALAAGIILFEARRQARYNGDE